MRWRSRSPRIRFTLAKQKQGLLLISGLIILVLGLASTMEGGWQIVLLKLFFVGFLAFLPGWLYLQLPPIKVNERYREYVLNLHRLRLDHIANLPEPPRSSVFWKEWSDSQPPGEDSNREQTNMYYMKFNTATGGERFAPVAVNTILMAVMWAVVIRPEGIPLRGLGDLTLSGRPEVPVVALSYGFVGAYLFILHSTVRRFFVLDLRSRAYVNGVARILLVSGIVIVLHTLPLVTSANQGAVLAFLIGFFPETGFDALRAASRTLSQRTVPSLRDPNPLTDLDGLSVYDEYRLMEEGVESLQNMLTVNLADLMLNTRIPVGRLVDWMDQALLYIRLGSESDGRQSTRTALRRYGIRTATDLLDVLSYAEVNAPKFSNGLTVVLNSDNEKGPNVLEGLRYSIQHDVNIQYLLSWKEYTKLEVTAKPHLHELATPADAVTGTAIS
jgi:hypothetical protein